jgi:hypothetical protein
MLLPLLQGPAARGLDDCDLDNSCRPKLGYFRDTEPPNLGTQHQIVAVRGHDRINTESSASRLAMVSVAEELVCPGNSGWESWSARQEVRCRLRAVFEATQNHTLQDAGRAWAGRYRSVGRYITLMMDSKTYFLDFREAACH